MQVDQNPLFIFRCDSIFRCVKVNGHAANFLVFFFERKYLVVVRKIAFHESWHAGVLLEDFRILHVL